MFFLGFRKLRSSTIFIVIYEVLSFFFVKILLKARSINC